MNSAILSSHQLFHGELQCPSIQASRLCAIDNNCACFCDGNSIHLLDLKNVENYNDLSLCEDSNVNRVKSTEINNICNISSTTLPNLNGSFQSICRISDDVVGAVNDQEIVTLLKLNRSSSVTFEFGSLYSSSCNNIPVGSGAWIGITQVENSIFTSNYLSRQVKMFDVESLKQCHTINLFGNPTAISSAYATSNTNLEPNNKVCAIGANCQLSLLDIRINNNQVSQSFKNIRDSNEHIWSILPLDNGNTIVTAGSDKIVCIYDSRMLKCRFKWRSPCKYDIAKLIACHSPPRSPVGGADDAQQLSSQERHKHLMYVAGRDNEVLLCDIEINDIKVRSKSKVPLPYKDRSLAHAEDKARSGDMECADTADNSSKRLKIMEEDDSGAKEGVTGSQVAYVLAPHNSEVSAVNHAPLPHASKLRISHHRGVHSESPWIGIENLANANREGNSEQRVEGDTLVGICGLGKMYVIRNANLMKSTSDNS